jgi:carboxypeptidase C (cathepsin A)
LRPLQSGWTGLDFALGMNCSILRLLLAAASVAVAASVAPAQEEPAAGAPDAADPPRRSFRTNHVAEFHGTRVAYEAIAGETILEDGEGKEQAAMFSISYLKEGIEHPEERPVTFLWNGGPGSSSVWLHMGAFGPLRVDVPSDARDDGGPPYRLLPNPGAFLDVSDVVFVDPVGTGFSVRRGEAKPEDFYGVREDARAMARFIRQWLREHGRWNSPKFIGGESYGTTRCAAVARELEGEFDDVALNGILLISTILDFSIVSTSTGNELPHAMHLPTMAATAWYHGRAGQGRELAAFVDEARAFALGRYAPALLRGAALPDAERAAIRAELARFTGLAEEVIERNDLRLHPERFQKELLRDRGLTVGRLDSRYTGVDLDDAGEHPEEDPSFYGIDGAYTATVNAYLRDTLQADLDREYVIIGGLGAPWKWDLGGEGRQTYLNLAPDLGRAMRQNSGLRVFVACGYYDFATPFFAAEYSLNRSGVVPERVRFAWYEAGHMMYVNHDGLAALQRDARDFILDTIGAR